MTDNVWKSRTGFILAAAGSAVGLGNLWKFPFIVGQSGGGAFLLFYLFCIVFIGWPALYAAVSLGYNSQKPAWPTLLQFPHGIWIARIAFLACNLVPAFYSVVGGWILGIFWEWASNLPHIPLHPAKTQMLIAGTFKCNAFWQLIFLAISTGIVGLGVNKGLEKGNQIMMPMLFVLLTTLLIYSLTLPGAQKAFYYLFSFDFHKLSVSNIMNGIGHSFFTLSVGCGGMITFGSYLPKGSNLKVSCTSVVIMDTVIAIMASLAIYSCIFSFDGHVQAGPALIFQSLPRLFHSLSYGGIIGTSFFLLIFLTATTSMVSLIEVLVATWMYKKSCSRHHAILYTLGGVSIPALLCNLSWNRLATVQIFDLSIFNFIDTATSTILMPVAGITFVVYFGWFQATSRMSQLLCRYITPGLLVISQLVLLFLA